MKLATQITELKSWLSKGVITKTPARLVGGLALGVLLLAAATTPIVLTNTSEGQPVNPVAVEEYETRFNVIDDYFWESLIEKEREVSPTSGLLTNESNTNKGISNPVVSEIDPAQVEEFAAAIYLEELGISSTVQKLNP
ncbi:MAG: hypothetical protein ACE5Q6_10650, partial [Dehalococcoidia bacterium]